MFFVIMEQQGRHVPLDQLQEVIEELLAQ
jgi:hypothetical protein